MNARMTIETGKASARNRVLKGERRSLEVRAVGVFLATLTFLGWLQLSWLSARFAPMGYTTALVFVVTGIAIVAHCMGQRTVAVWGGAFAAGIGSMALAEDLLGRSTMIVSALLPSNVSEAASTAQPRMSIMTALCFALSGLALVTFRTRGMRRRWRRTTLLVLASVIVGTGVVGLLGYALSDQSEYGWAKVTRMNASTALGFVVLGTAFFAMIGGLRRPDRIASVPRWAPWAFGGVVGALAVALWVNLTASDAKISRMAMTRANGAAVHSANTQLRLHADALARTGQVAGVLSRSLQAVDAIEMASLLAADLERPGVTAVVQLDAEGREVSRLGDNEALDFALGVLPPELATATSEAVVSSTISTGRGHGYLWLTVPVGGSGGMFAYLHDIRALLGSIFRHDAMRAIHVDVADANGVVFELGRGKRRGAEDSQRALASVGQIALGDSTWTIRTTADARWLSGSRGVSNTLLLWFGGFLAASITLVIRMTQRERERAGSLHEANDIIARQFQKERHATEQLKIQAVELRLASMRIDEQASEQRRVLDSLSAFVIGVDAEGRVVEWNSVAQELFGVDTNEAFGANFEDLDLPWLEGRAADRIRECVESGQRTSCQNLMIPTLGARDEEDADDEEDEGLAVSFTVNPTERGSSRGYSIIGADVTERRRLETQLHHAQRLEAVGTLAAGIAHEINTPMQYVGDNLRFVSEQVGPLIAMLRGLPEALTEARGAGCDAPKVLEVESTIQAMDIEFVAEELPLALSETLEGVERVTSIVRAMKDFSHPGGEGRKPADINRALETTVAVARNEYKYVADVDLQLGELPLVPSWLADLNQVFLNLIVNAAHAIEEAIAGTGGRGTITISTSSVCTGDNNSEEWAEIRIGDSGCGIPEDVGSQVFDQFFTTKEVGKGTGQGLAIAHAVVVDKHGGHLDFESERGVGTTFIIRLPIHEVELEHHEPAHPDPVC